MNRTVTTWVALAGLAAAVAAAWWLQRPAAPATAATAATAPARDAASRAVTVEVGTATRMRLVDAAEAVGTLRSRRGVMLKPEVSGRVAAIGFDEGQRVRRGQLLVQLDDTLQRAQLREKQAQAANAATQLQRNRDLAAQNFLSRSAVDTSAAALEVAQAQVAVAQAQLARMRIHAPFDGQAGVRHVAVGDYVKEGADLVNVEDTSQLWVDYRLPERYLTRVRPGLAVEVSVDALPGVSFTGRIEALDSLVDPQGRSLLVRARLEDPKQQLKPGMFARTRTVLGTRDDAVVVPEEAVVPLAGKQYVVKVVRGAGGIMSQRLEAQLGMRVPGKVEVLAGLVAGDLVVTAGQAQLLGEQAQTLHIVTIDGAASAPPAPARPAA